MGHEDASSTGDAGPSWTIVDSFDAGFPPATTTSGDTSSDSNAAGDGPAAAKRTTVHAGSIDEAAGRSTRPASASAQARWRVAADARRAQTISVAATRASRNESLRMRVPGVMTCLPGRERV